MMPILAATAVGMGIDPVLLMAPAVLAASCSFMLPVGTPPNALVYSTGLVPVGAMIRAGVVMNFVSIVVLTLLSRVLL